MRDNTLSKKIGFSFFWKIMENSGSQGVQFIISILLARLLSPKEYGQVAIATIFINIANVIIQNGFATALIRKKEDNQDDYNSVLLINIFVALILYILLYFSSPYIAKFYNNNDIINIFRALGIVMFPGAIISVQNAYIVKKLQFKNLFIGTILSASISGFMSIYLAFRAFGVYALVFQQLIYYFSLMLILFFISDFRFRIRFDIYRVRALFDFGWKILCASLIDISFENLNALVLGKVYSEQVLGNYNRGEQFPKLIVMNLGSAIQSIMLPLMSSFQDEKEKIRFLLKSSISLSSYIIFPMMFGMIAISDTLVLVLLGEKWKLSIPFLRWLCLAYAFWPIHIANLQAINALGRSDKFLKLEILKKALGLIILAFAIYKGSLVVVAMKAFADFIGIFINAYPNKALLDYDIKMQLRDILPSLLLSIIMALVIFCIGYLFEAGFLKLIILILLGIIIYILLSIISRNKDYYFLMEQILKIRRNDGK